MEARRYRGPYGVTDMPIETVTIVRADSPRGYRIIAKSDFDPEAHELYEAPVEESTDETAGDEVYLQQNG